VSFIRTLVLGDQVPTLKTSLNINLSYQPYLQIATWRVGVSTYQLWRDTSIQSMAPCNSRDPLLTHCSECPILPQQSSWPQALAGVDGPRETCVGLTHELSLSRVEDVF
jgi:hypothetical protein